VDKSGARRRVENRGREGEEVVQKTGGGEV
jgi:hypothetical protein